MRDALEGKASFRATDDGSWRDVLSLRAAKASALFYALGTVVIVMTIRRPQPLLMMASVGLTCCLLATVIALSGRPRGTLRAWCIVGPSILVSIVGFGMVGFLSGPSVLLSVSMTLGGLLLGKRAMMALLGVAVAGIGLVAWAMIHSIIPTPVASDVAMKQVVPWVRTISIMILAIGFLSGLLIEIVAQMERLLSQAQQETRRREEAERAKAQTEIMSLSNKQLETIGQLAAGIAHDFNNNLSVIIGSAELLREELQERDVPHALVEDILTSSQRAANLTRQLLAYSRKAQMVMVPTDVHQLLDDTVGMLRRSIDPRVEVVAKLNAENANVLADATLLNSSLLNLLVNARDAMPNGGQLTIATSSHEVTTESSIREHGLAPGAYVLIEVLDTGEGITAEVLPSIFDPFFTTKPIGKGTGLGLAAVAGTVKSHKGSIDVESEIGCGTAFRILLPCCTTANSVLTQAAAKLTLGSGRVLLVDDDALVRRAAAATLHSLGYEVTVATDGIHALELFREATEPFRVVILDLRMPRMDGETTFEELHRLAPSLPIVIWSGYGGELDVEVMLRKGASGFIQKPYRIVELSHVVHRAIFGRMGARTGTDSA